MGGQTFPLAGLLLMVLPGSHRARIPPACPSLPTAPRPVPVSAAVFALAQSPLAATSLLQVSPGRSLVRAQLLFALG